MRPYGAALAASDGTLLMTTGAEAIENAVKIARASTGRSAVLSALRMSVRSSCRSAPGRSGLVFRAPSV